ncbi:PD-(D/E)XK motif protein [Butyrivibrio sp. AE2032]|uniref:PD-(D/E)XK motif protein n=1 Tax=Butyrivibrio sp. AE2032 TaxID=1458463 RepID=UPI000557B690|nr:PD-(D/E)XK motif protein [Butyrivibrio sp. AE2032]
MKTDFTSRFAGFNKPGYFVKAQPDNDVEWYIGMDDDGNKCLKYRGVFEPASVHSTKFVKVKQYVKEIKTITFSLLDNNYCYQYYIFCEDMVESTIGIQNEQMRYDAIVSVFYKWMKMFQKTGSDILSEEKIRGLMAEIYFLKEYVIPTYGKHDAVQSWSGQELTHKDFSIRDTWYEIKSVLKGKPSVHISSLEQLDSNVEGYLVVYYFEKMSTASNGQNLNELVKSVLDVLDSELDKDIFYEEVTKQGFSFDERYEEFKYIISNRNSYIVSGDFPRLTRSNIDVNIDKVEYSINLLGLEPYRSEL